MANDLQTELSATPGREPPVIDPANVSVEFIGLNLRKLFVRLPRDFILDDLKEPKVWRRVQAHFSKSLRKFDEVLLVSYDESWIARAFVGHADSMKAVLARPEKVSFPDRFERLPEDELYKTVWNGVSFDVVRRKDNHVMGKAATIGAAQRMIDQLYPLVTR
jgi:hypothetical protein